MRQGTKSNKPQAPATNLQQYIDARSTLHHLSKASSVMLLTCELVIVCFSMMKPNVATGEIYGLGFRVFLPPTLLGRARIAGQFRV